MKKTDYANINQKKVRVGILISDKGEFRPLKITRDKEIFYNYKMADHQKYLAILNVYALAKELNLCEENSWNFSINKTTVIVGDINSPLSTIDGRTRKKMSNDVKELSNFIQEDLIIFL